MAECIFCKIGTGAVPASIVDRDDGVLAIEDLNPQAPAHALVMPVEHYATIDELAGADAGLAARTIALAARIGRRHGGDGGFRLVVNTGPEGGQTVGHVHVHVLSGRTMSWPPG